MKYFRIEYGCGCGDNEEYIKAYDETAAINEAYEKARDDYEAYEGFHGIRTWQEVAEEDFGLTESEARQLDFTSELFDEISDAYIQEVEESICYRAEEVSKEEYLENYGRDN